MFRPNLKRTKLQSHSRTHHHHPTDSHSLNRSVAAFNTIPPIFLK